MVSADEGHRVTRRRFGVRHPWSAAGGLPPAILPRRVIFWSHLSGLLSLELDRHLVSMQLDPELLYRAELAELGAET
jgi:hypothetical protein